MQHPTNPVTQSAAVAIILYAAPPAMEADRIPQKKKKTCLGSELVRNQLLRRRMNWLIDARKNHELRFRTLSKPK